jgi:transcriptional activator SPT7
MEIDGQTLSGMALNRALGEAAEQIYEDEEYKIWKQVTKKDRALVARDRFLLFKDRNLNGDAPALLRSKAGMRRFLKGQKQAESNTVASQSQADSSTIAAKESATNAETLAEEMEGEVEKVIPDYYIPLSLVPDIPPNLQWLEDGEGQVINQHEWSLRLMAPGLFRSPVSRLTSKIDSNIRQIQETRKLATKISVIKQMQIQTQVCFLHQVRRSPSLS